MNVGMAAKEQTLNTLKANVKSLYLKVEDDKSSPVLEIKREKESLRNMQDENMLTVGSK